MAELPRKVSAVPRRRREAVRTALRRAAGLYAGRVGSRLLRFRGGSDNQAPPRAGRDGSPRAGRRAGEGLAEGSPQEGRAGSPRAGRTRRARCPQLARCGADGCRLPVNHRPEAGKGPG